MAEAHAERVDPEVVGQLGVTGGDVPGHALAEAEAAEQAQGAGQALLAVQAFLLHGGKDRWDRSHQLRGLWAAASLRK